MRRGGRLFLLLGVLIAAAAAIFFILFAQQIPGIGGSNQSGQIVSPTAEREQQIVVARIDIASNTVLTDTETLLTLDTIPESQYNSSPNSYFTDPSELSSKITISTITANRPVLSSDVTDAGLSLQIPAGQNGRPRPKAYPFQVNNLTGVADQITPGDFVDVIASFTVQQTLLRPGVDETGSIIIKEEQFNGQSTKTLVQNVQVLRIQRPQPPAEGTPTPEAEPTAVEYDPNGNPVGQAASPNASNTLSPGNWILLLALTDQQAEVVKYAQEQGVGVTLVLRGRGDTAEETTTGATLDLLVSQFGVPLPRPVAPAVVTNNQLTPVPTSATQPTSLPTPTP